MPLSPEALAKIAEAIPDSYDTNPEQFATDYAALQAARAEAERLKQVGEWYETNYKPWFNAYGDDFAEFEKWKTTKDTPEPAPTPTPTQTFHDRDGTIDWNDPHQAVRQVYDTMQDQLAATRNDVALVKATLDTRSEELQRLLALQEQAYGLINEETWREVGVLKNQPDWRPALDIPKLVSYAQQHNIPDLRRAYTDYNRTDREKAIEQSAYERGRQAAAEEAARAAAARTTTTEVTGGTPFRRGRGLPEATTGRPWQEGAMEAIAQKLAARRGGM
jgi:hypothetical protein